MLKLKDKTRAIAINDFYIVSKIFSDDTLMTALSLRAVGAMQRPCFILRDLPNLWIVKYREELKAIAELSDEKKDNLFWYVKELIIKSEKEDKSPFSLFKVGEFLK